MAINEETEEETAANTHLFRDTNEPGTRSAIGGEGGVE